MARRAAIVAASVLALLLLASQLALPPLAAERVEDRLTEGGGSAEVSVSALPALRLLFSDGDRLEARGAELDLELAGDEPDVLGRLDGFGEVDVVLANLRAGPFEVESFELRRQGSAPYAVRSRATTSAAALAEYGADRLGLSGGPLLRFLVGQAPQGDRPVPISLDLEMESDDGRILVTEGGGSVAGYPTGPLAELLTAAIVIRL